MNSSSVLYGKLFFYSLSGVSCALGVWQVRRFYWKVDTINESKNSFEVPPVDIVAKQYKNQEKLYETCEELKRKRVLLRGKYVLNNDLLLGLRSGPLSAGKKAATGMGVNPQGTVR